MLSFIAILSY